MVCLFTAMETLTKTVPNSTKYQIYRLQRLWLEKIQTLPSHDHGYIPKKEKKSKQRPENFNFTWLAETTNGPRVETHLLRCTETNTVGQFLLKLTYPQTRSTEATIRSSWPEGKERSVIGPDLSTIHGSTIQAIKLSTLTAPPAKMKAMSNASKSIVLGRSLNTLTLLFGFYNFFHFWLIVFVNWNMLTKDMDFVL